MRAAEAIRTIVADAEAAFDGTRWPWHPRDGEEFGFSDVYIGGAGMIWALDELGSTGWEDAAVSFVDHYRARPSPWDEDPVETSYHFGEAGIALVAFRLTRDAGLADRVHELVLAGLDSEANEVMYGTPGSMLVAEAMLAWTGEPRWDEAWRAAAERVESARDADGLWTSNIGGHAARYLGPAHGYAGNVRAFANRGAVSLADPSPYPPPGGRPRPLLALHRRHRRRALPPPPARRGAPLPDDGPVLELARRLAGPVVDAARSVDDQVVLGVARPDCDLVAVGIDGRSRVLDGR